MAIISSGYDGSVDELAWAVLAPLVGINYGVLGHSDWQVTAKPAADRTVRIGTGTGAGQGVVDVSDAVVELQHDIVTSGTRYDMIVARRSWAGEGGSTTFAIIKGSSSPSTLPPRNKTPGAIDDQPIALVALTAGQSQPTAIFDLRIWAGEGGAVARDGRVLQYLDHPGAVVRIGTEIYTRMVTPSGGHQPATGSSWDRQRLDASTIWGYRGALVGTVPTSPAPDFFEQEGYEELVTASDGAFNLILPKAFPNGILTFQASLYTSVGVNTIVPAYLTLFARNTTAQYKPTLQRVSGQVYQPSGAPYRSAAVGISWRAKGW